MQRRRRKKAAPKNIFGATSQAPSKTQGSSISKSKPPKSRSPRAAPPSLPGSRPKPKAQPKPLPKKQVEDLIEEESEEIEATSEEQHQEQQDEVILQDQILGDTGVESDIPEKKPPKPKKKQATAPIEEEPQVEDSGKSLKARQIIEDSMLKASLAAVEEKTNLVKKKETPDEKKKPQRKFRSKTSSYQPANRARRLDRSKHMEYKYEMRGLLVEIGVSEEYRSNLLATIWARGERQTTKEAKEFLQEKLEEGVIDNDQMTSLEGVVDSYTIRR